MESSPPCTPHSRAASTDQADAWNHAVRVAFFTSLVAAAAGVVLYRVVGVSAWIVVPLLVFGGWLVGCHLPPARPAAHPTGRGGLRLVTAHDDRSDAFAAERLAA